jgi:hypothetical protein
MPSPDTVDLGDSSVGKRLRLPAELQRTLTLVSLCPIPALVNWR